MELEKQLALSARGVFELQAFTPCAPCPASWCADSACEGAVRVSFSGPLEGIVELRFFGDLMGSLSLRMLGTETVTREQTVSAVAEVANIVCGKFTESLAGGGRAFNLSQPVFAGPDSPAEKTADCACSLGFDCGRVDLLVWFRPFSAAKKLV